MSVENLKQLKSKLERQEMSVLVGAGFSKNVSNELFPSWWELLYDMTFFLFENEIKESWKNESKKRDKKRYFKDKVDQYISKVGYLDIVSMYISKKGFRESISAYIEERTPKVIDVSGVKYLKCKNGEVELTKEMLSQHRALLSLPWNNIYTTNYDEMLEEANGRTSIESITKKIEEIKPKRDELIEKLRNLEIEINETENLISQIDRNENDAWTNGDYNAVKHRMDYLVEFRKQLGRFKKQEADKNEDLLILDEKWDILHKLKNNCLTEVYKAEDLSLKRNNNIIKLHGSLRKDGEPYGFDGDIRKQYVISREDYDTYPKKHEAFTQLMRISLLQESYCLIGFSGDDYNFLEWVKWVRDILERKRISEKEYKIYFLDLSKSEISEEKRLFYDNHSICRVSLTSQETLDFLFRETKNKIKEPSYKEIFLLLFDYLSNGLKFNLIEAFLENENQNKYHEIWENIKLDIYED